MDAEGTRANRWLTTFHPIRNRTDAITFHQNQLLGENLPSLPRTEGMRGWTGEDSQKRFMIRPQFTLDLNRELIVDNFAGGGGVLGAYVSKAERKQGKAVAA